MWRSKLHEHKDTELLLQVLHRGASFHGCQLKALNWVFSLRPEELWEKVDRLVHTAHQNYHEGLAGNKGPAFLPKSGLWKKKKVNGTKNGH